MMEASKWEYKSVRLRAIRVNFWNQTHDPVELDKALNELGIEGWELVQVYFYWGGFAHCVFKRHLP